MYGYGDAENPYTVSVDLLEVRSGIKYLLMKYYADMLTSLCLHLDTKSCS